MRRLNLMYASFMVLFAARRLSYSPILCYARAHTTIFCVFSAKLDKYTLFFPTVERRRLAIRLHAPSPLRLTQLNARPTPPQKGAPTGRMRGYFAASCAKQAACYNAPCTAARIFACRVRCLTQAPETAQEQRSFCAGGRHHCPFLGGAHR